MENLFLISFKIQSIISTPLGSYTVHAIIKRKEKKLTTRLKKNGQLDANFLNLVVFAPAEDSCIIFSSGEFGNATQRVLYVGTHKNQYRGYEGNF